MPSDTLETVQEKTALNRLLALFKNSPGLKVEDITCIETEKEFEHLIIANIKTRQEKNYEILFLNDEEKNCLPFGEKKEEVNKLEKGLNKKFKAMNFDDGVCYCYIIEK